MVDRQKVKAAVKSGARRGLKAGALLVGMSIVASCSMFGEDSSDQPAAAEPAAAAEAAERRDVGPVSEGLVGDSGNARYDESIRRRPVTTVRPLEDAPAEAQVPAPVPAPTSSAPVEAAPQAAATPEPAAAPAPAPAPAPVAEAAPVEAAPVAAVAAKPSGASPVIAESKPAPTPLVPAADSVPEPPPEPEPEPQVAAAPVPVPVPVPTPAPLVADTSRLDAAVAHAYGANSYGSRMAPMGPSTGGGGIVHAGGPVVVGGGIMQPAMQPAVTSQGGTVVVGGAQPAVVVGGGYGAAASGSALNLPAGTPTAVIHFGFGSTALTARDRQVIRQVADLQARQGGFVRVVGHSSQFTANMPQERHMLVNFETSVARADAVAEALVREGVPLEVLETAAVGSSQPVYQEVMPAGQVGNQRVEIYLVR